MVSRRARDVGLCLFSIVLFTVLFHVFRPRNHIAPIAPPTSHPSPPAPLSHVVLSSISGLSLSNVSHFLQSIRSSCPPNALIVLFADAKLVDQRLRSIAHQYNVTIQLRTYNGPLLNDGTAWRFAEFEKWLTSHESLALNSTWVFLTDAHGITFQRNIFETSVPALTSVVFFASSRLIKQDTSLEKQLDECVSKPVADSWQNRSIIGSSSVFASFMAAKSYAAMMNSELERSELAERSNQSPKCKEEGMQIRLAYDNSVPQLQIVTADNDLFYINAAGAPMERNDKGKATTPLGRVPCVVQQLA